MNDKTITQLNDTLDGLKKELGANRDNEAPIWNASHIGSVPLDITMKKDGWGFLYNKGRFEMFPIGESGFYEHNKLEGYKKEEHFPVSDSKMSTNSLWSSKRTNEEIHLISQEQSDEDRKTLNITLNKTIKRAKSELQEILKLELDKSVKREAGTLLEKLEDIDGELTLVYDNIKDLEGIQGEKATITQLRGELNILETQLSGIVDIKVGKVRDVVYTKGELNKKFKQLAERIANISKKTKEVKEEKRGLSDKEIKLLIDDRTPYGHRHKTSDIIHDGGSLDEYLANLSVGGSLPDQTGNNGKFLTTDGSDASWGTISGGGDMLIATYDPLGKSANAFSTDNHVDGTTNKVFSATEKTKLAGIAESANNYSHPNHSGDVTSVADGATTIANDAVTYAKMQNVSAENKILGRITAGAGNTEELTAANVRTIINVADGANAYVHPNHSGDVTSVADGATTIASGVVTLAKMANLAQDKIIGRVTGSTGVPEALTAANVRTIINVEDGADVTDATNVAAAGATMDSELIATSAGAGDAGKPIKLDAAGHVDATMINDADINLDSVTEGSTNKFFTSTEKTKLSGIETAADVTDAANVSAAGAPIISSGAGAPGSTPSKVGDVYIDTTGDDAYIAVGVASSADWEKSNDGTSAGGGVDTANSPGVGEFAKFTDADTIEGRTAAETRADLDLEAGTDFLSIAAIAAAYQPLDSDLTTIAGLTATTDNFIVSASSAWASRTPSQVRTTLNVADGANAYVHPNHSGDVTSVADGATTIATAAVSLAKMANLAQNTIIGRVTASTGVPEALSATNVRTIINVEDGADVTDATNVEAAGALMDSEVDADIKTLALPASTTISTFGASIIDDANEATFKATVNLEIGTDVQAYNADLTSLATNWVQATAAGASSLDFHEDTDNGTNKVTVIAPASVVTSDKILTLPDATDTLIGKDTTDTLTNKRLTSPKINEDVVMTASATELNVLDGIPGTLTATELGYVDGVTSSIQTQIGTKAAHATTITVAGTASEITSSAGAQDLSTNRTWTLSLPTSIDLGGKTSFEIPNGAGGTTLDTTGEIGIDSTSKTLNFFDGANEVVLNPIRSKSVTILAPVAGDDFPLHRMDVACTLVKVSYLCLGGTNWIGQVVEMDANGGTATDVHSADITATAGTVNTSTTFSNASLDAGDYLGIETTSISGTPTSLTITVYYRENA